VPLSRTVTSRDRPPTAATLPVHYKGLDLDAAYRIDIKVEGILILELKAVDKLEAIHDAQLLTYLRLSDLWLGLLMNFNVVTMKNGIKRLVHGS
jgi:GxxExxY protein